MQIRITSILLGLIMLVGCSPKSNKATQNVGEDKGKLYNIHPIKLWVNKSKPNSKITLRIEAIKDFAIQDISYNRLALKQTLKNSKITLKGQHRSDKPEYFKSIRPISIPVVDGNAKLEGRLFYCHLIQNFCSQKKINLEISI